MFDEAIAKATDLFDRATQPLQDRAREALRLTTERVLEKIPQPVRAWAEDAVDGSNAVIKPAAKALVDRVTGTRTALLPAAIHAETASVEGLATAIGVLSADFIAWATDLLARVDSATLVSVADMLDAHGRESLRITANVLEPMVFIGGGLAPGNENRAAFFLGMLEGLEESRLLSARHIYDHVLGAGIATVLGPATSLAFVAGTLVAIVRDLLDTVQAVIDAIGFADEIPRLVSRLLPALPAIVQGFVDPSHAESWRSTGRQIGLALATQVGQELLPNFSQVDGATAILKAVMDVAYNAGTYFGPLLVDLLLSLTGIGAIEVGVKLLARAGRLGKELLETMLELLKKILKSIDPKLLDELLAFSSRIVRAIDDRLTRLIADLASTGDFSAEEMKSGLERLRGGLGDDTFRSSMSKFFCKLDGSR
jgi:hypothetical protein